MVHVLLADLDIAASAPIRQIRIERTWTWARKAVIEGASSPRRRAPRRGHGGTCREEQFRGEREVGEKKRRERGRHGGVIQLASLHDQANWH